MKNNIYSAPSSDLAIDKNDKKSLPIVWFLYFLFWMSINLFSTYLLFEYQNVGVAEYIDLVFFPIDIVLFYGFLFKKHIMDNNIWKVYFFINLLWIISYPFITQIDFSQGLEYKYHLIGQTISFLLFLPQYIVTYLYAFRSKDIWKKRNA